MANDSKIGLLAAADQIIAETDAYVDILLDGIKEATDAGRDRNARVIKLNSAILFTLAREPAETIRMLAVALVRLQEAEARLRDAEARLADRGAS